VNQAAFISTTDIVDPVFIFIFGCCLVLLVAIATTMVIFVVRYRRSRAPEPTSAVSSNLWLEVIWTLLPTLLVLIMFWYGWQGYVGLRTVPTDALEVTATARMWSWQFAYPGGANSPKLYVPVGKPVKVNLVATDVIHGFFIPAFRVKHDMVPGMQSHVWFVANRPGSYDLFCSQYCGTNHASMITTVEALPAPEFEEWREHAGKGEKHLDGSRLAQEKGCLGCHSLDGSLRVGPSFKGIMGRRQTVLSNGSERTITVDAAYLRASIHDPAADVVKGYQAIMPVYKDLSTAELDALVNFLKDVK
jgi:cytochrome c oxidase subunit 2